MYLSNEEIGEVEYGYAYHLGTAGTIMAKIRCYLHDHIHFVSFFHIIHMIKHDAGTATVKQVQYVESSLLVAICSWNKHNTSLTSVMYK